jgi:hypothetical protein
VAHLLTGLVTNTVPRSAWARTPRPEQTELLAAHRRLGRRLAHPHLPQGAPTSPVLANLAAFGLDRRLSGLAAATGCSYSRYADDLAFSFASHRTNEKVRGLLNTVDRIVRDEGFRCNTLKTFVRRAGQRQRLSGVIINDRPNMERKEYDRLKAILHNAAHTGPAPENRAQRPRFRQHLEGRISWVTQLNPARGERLMAAFERIDWSGAGPESRR